MWLLQNGGVTVYNGGFTAYKIRNNGFYTSVATGTVTISNLIIAEAGLAAHILAGGGTNGLYTLSSSTIIARLPEIENGCGGSSVGYKLGCVAGTTKF